MSIKKLLDFTNDSLKNMDSPVMVKITFDEDKNLFTILTDIRGCVLINELLEDYEKNKRKHLFFNSNSNTEII